MTRKTVAATAGSWDTRLLGIVVTALVVFGIAAVYSASSIWAVRQGQPGSALALKQLLGGVGGVALLLVASRIDYHIWQRHAWVILGVTTFFLIIPMLPFTRGLTPELNGARRWLVAGPITFQPSEFAKFAIVAWVAMLAAKKGTTVRQLKRGILPFLVVVVPVSTLILLQPDLSNACLVALVAGIILFTAGARIGHFLLLGLVTLLLFWRQIVGVQYRLARVATFLSPGTEVSEASWQIQQSLIGVGTGGLLGVGFGQGLQKLGYLPYAYSDFVFSTIAEEWGFIGGSVILLLYVTFIALGFRIARTAGDRFGMLLATGLTSLIGVTALLHIAVTLSVVPTTGLPLPFVSFGRSNLVVSMLAAGVLLNIGERRFKRAAGR